MLMRGILLNLGGIALCAASLAWSGSPNPALLGAVPAAVPVKSAPAAKAPPLAEPEVRTPAPSPGNASGYGNIQGTTAPAAIPKPVLAEAFIAQAVLRIYLNRPASVYVYNSRGQQVFHIESQRALETVPLLGVSTGFIYLTVRTAQGETTKKLVFTGK
jgi:hypothetical protein